MITTLMRRARAVATRATLKNPDWDAVWLSGGKSVSGVRVTERTALKYAPVWRAVNLIASDVGRLPLIVYRRVEGDGKERATAHPAYHLLKYQPSDEVDAFQFRRTLTADALLWGNGFAAILDRPPEDGVVRQELVRLDPAATFPLENTDDGTTDYITVINGQNRTVTRDKMFHLRGLGDGIWGHSVIAHARDSLGLGMGAEEYGNRFYRNNARPSMVLEYPSRLEDADIERLRASWHKVHGDLSNAHRPAILEMGMKATVLSTSNEDAQFLETRAFQIRDVANWFGIPPHKLGDPSRTSFASLEQENQSYLDSLDPWLVAWESEARRKLLSPRQRQRDTHLVEFVRLALVRTDMTTRAGFYTQALANGWMNRNEVRARENLGPIPDGDQFILPLNVGAAEDVLEGEEEPDGPPELPPQQLPPPRMPPGDDDEEDEEGDRESPEAPEGRAPGPGGAPQDGQQPAGAGDRGGDHGALEADQRRQLALAALERVLDDALGRVMTRLCNKAKRLAKRPQALGRWLAGSLEEDRGLVESTLAPVLGALACHQPGERQQPAMWPVIVSRFQGDLDAGGHAVAAVVDNLRNTLPGLLRAMVLETDDGD